MTRPIEGGESDRSASLPAPIETPGEAGRPHTRPMQRLEFWDTVLGNSTKTRNMIRIVRAVTLCLATIIAAIGLVMVSAPSEHVQLIATALVSAATTAVTGMIGIGIRNRRNRSGGPADEPDDTGSGD